MILSVVAAATAGADPSAFIAALASEGVLTSPDVEVLIVQGPSGPIRHAPPGIEMCVLAAHASIFELWGAGIKQARADAVAILDVRCPLQTGWLAAVRAELPLLGSRILFGSVICSMAGNDPNIVGYLTEYVQFNPPLDPLCSEVPGVNFVAARSDLTDERVLRADGFAKTRLLAMLAASNTLSRQLIAGAAVDYQKCFSFGEYIAHRFRHGRSFAAGRPFPSLPTKIRAVISTPCLPVLRSWRIYRNAKRDPACLRAVRRFWLRIVVAETAWSFGEFLGYVTGEGRTRPHLR